VLIVAIGANDGLRGVPVATVKANVSQIVHTARDRGISVVLCGMEALPIHGMAYSIAFHDAFADLVSRYDVAFVPFLLKNVILDPDMLQPDRIHPNAAGARRIAENIWPYLEAVLRAPASPW
jgi:acyl-CoA thioesterase-1